MAEPSGQDSKVKIEDILSIPTPHASDGNQAGVVTFSGSVSAGTGSGFGRDRRRGWRLPSAAGMVRRKSSFKAGQPGVQSNLPVQLEVLPSATSMGVHHNISATLRFLVRDIQCLDPSRSLGLRLAAAGHARLALSKYSHQQAALALLWSAARPLLWEANVSARNAAFDIACDMCTHHFYALGALRGEFLYMIVLAHRGDEPQRQRLLRRATQDGASVDPYADAVAAALAGFSDMDSDHKAFCTMIARTCHKGARCLPPKVVGMIARRLCHITRRALRRESALCRRAIEAFEALLSSKALEPSSLPRVVDALTRLVNVECKATWGVFRRLLADTHFAPIVLQLLLDTLHGDNPVSKSTPTTSSEHMSVQGATPPPAQLDAGGTPPLQPRPTPTSRVAGISSSALRGAVYLLSMARYSYSAQPSAQQIPLLTVALALRRASECDATAVLQEVLLSLARMVKQFGPHLIAEWPHLAAVLHKAARWCHQRRKLQHATMQAMQAASHLSRAGAAGRMARPSAAAGVGVAAPAVPKVPNLPAGLSAEPVTGALRGFALSIVGLFLSGQYHGSDEIAASMWEALPDIMPEHSQLLQLQSAVSAMAHGALQSGVQAPAPGSGEVPWWHGISSIVRQFYIEQAFPAVRACAIHAVWLLWRATRHLHGSTVAMPEGKTGSSLPPKGVRLDEVFIQHGFKPLLVSCYAEVDPSVRTLLMAVSVSVSQVCHSGIEHSPVDLQLAVLCNSQHMAVVKSSDADSVASWSRAWHTRAVLPASELRVGFLDAACILSLVRVSHLDATTSVVASEREQALQALQLLSDAVESECGQHVIQLQSEKLQSAVERLPLDIVAASRSSVAQLATAGLMHRLLAAACTGGADTVRLVVGVLQGLATHHSFPGTRFHALVALHRVALSSPRQMEHHTVVFAPSAAAHVAATAGAGALQESHAVDADTAACLEELGEVVRQHTFAVCLAGLRACLAQVASREKAHTTHQASTPPSKSLSDFLAPPSILSPSAAEFLLALHSVCARALCLDDCPQRLVVLLELLTFTTELSAAILECSDPWTEFSFGSPPTKCAFAPLDLLSSLVNFVSAVRPSLQSTAETLAVSQLLSVLCVDCTDILREACLCAVPVADHELRPADSVSTTIQSLASSVAALGTLQVQVPPPMVVHPAPLLQALLLCVSSAFGCLQSTEIGLQQRLCVLALCNCAGSVSYAMLLTGRTQDDSVVALAQQVSVMCLTAVCKLAAGMHWAVEDPPAVSERRAGFRPNKMPQAARQVRTEEYDAATGHRMYLHALQVAYRCFVEAFLAASRLRRRVLHQQLNPLLVSISKSLRANLSANMSQHPHAPGILAVERCLGILSACHSLVAVMHQHHSHKLGFVELDHQGGALMHTLSPGEEQYWNTRSRQGFHVRVLYGAPLELNAAAHPRHFPRSEARPHKHDLLNSGRLVKAMTWETQNTPDVDTATALLQALFQLPSPEASPKAAEGLPDADTEWAFVHSGRLYSVRVGCGLQVSIRCRQITVCEEWHGGLEELLQAAPQPAVTHTTEDNGEVPESQVTAEDMYSAQSPDRVERSGSLATITATSFSQSAIERPLLLQGAERDISVLHFAVRDQDITAHDGSHWDAASTSSDNGSDDGTGSYGYFGQHRRGTGLDDFPLSAQLRLLQSDTELHATDSRTADASDIVRVGRGHSFASDEMKVHLGGVHSNSRGESFMALSLSPVPKQPAAAADSEGDVSPGMNDVLGMVSDAVSDAGATRGHASTEQAPPPVEAPDASGKSVSPEPKPMQVIVHPMEVQDLYQSQNPESDSVVVFGVGASASAHSPRRRHTAWDNRPPSSPRSRAPVGRTLSIGHPSNDLDGVALRRSISARESLNAVRQRLKRVESSDIFGLAASSTHTHEGIDASAQSTSESEHFLSPHELQASLSLTPHASTAPVSPATIAASSPGLTPALTVEEMETLQVHRSDTEGSLVSFGSHSSPVLGALSAQGRSPSREAGGHTGISTGMAARKWSMVSAASSEMHSSARSRQGSEDIVQGMADSRKQANHHRTNELLALVAAKATASEAAYREKVASIQAAFETDVGDMGAIDPSLSKFEDPECLAAISSASLIWAYLNWGAAPPDLVPSAESVAHTLQRKAIIPIKCEQRVLQRSLAVLDRTQAVDTCKVGVVYVKQHQCNERDILLNQHMDTSAAFRIFVARLGWQVNSECCPSWLYLGGISRTGGTDGEHSLVWHSRSGALQMAFHVAPWIRSANISVNAPDTEEVFVRVKRHIGNDFVTVAFVEDGGEANLSTFTGHFSNVLILVQPCAEEEEEDSRAQSPGAQRGARPAAFLITVLSKQALSATTPLNSSAGVLSRPLQLEAECALAMAGLGATGLQRALSTVCVDGCAGHSTVPPTQAVADVSKASDISGVHADPRSLFSRVDGLRGDSGRDPSRRSGHSHGHGHGGKSDEDSHTHTHLHKDSSPVLGQVARLAFGGRLMQCGQARVPAEDVGQYVRQLAVQCDIAVRASVPTALHASPLSGPAARFEQYQRVLTRLMGSS